MDIVDRRIEDGVLVELYRRGDALEVRRDGELFEASDAPRVERQVLELALAPWQGRDDISVLVTSLGMGHTARAALDLPGVVRVDALEPSAALRDWHDGHFAALTGKPLADKRARLHPVDLAGFLAQPHEDGGWFVVLVDRRTALAAGEIERLETSVRSGGVVAVWRPERDDGLMKEMSSRLNGVVKVAVPVDSELHHVYRGRTGPVKGRMLN